jgi:hypothetical protein
VTGSFQPALALIAAAIAVLSYLFTVELLDDRRIATVAAAVIAASPFVWLRSGTMLAYGWSLTLELTIGVLVLRTRRTNRDGGWIAIGVVAGVLAFTRPFDALILGVPIAIWLAVERRRGFVRIAALVVLGSLPGIVLMFWNNAHLTGSPLQFPLHATGGDNEFGFGWRRIAAGAPRANITVLSSIRSLAIDLWRALAWSYGSVLALPVAAFGVSRLYRRWLPLGVLAAIAVLFPFFNLFYWGNWLIAHTKDFLGPHYYLPLAVVMGVLVAVGLCAIDERSRVLAVGVAAALAGASVVMVVPKIRDNRYFTNQARHEWSAIDHTVGNDHAIVVVPASVDGGWIGHPRPSMLNDRGLKQRILFSPDRGSDGLALPTAFTDRSLFRLQPGYITRRTHTRVAPRVDRLQFYDTPVMRLQVTVTPQVDDRFVRLYATSGSTEISALIDNVSRPGATTTVPVLIFPDDRVQIGNVTGRIPTGNGVAIGIAYRPTTSSPMDTLRQEERIWTNTRDGRVQASLPGQQWWTLPKPGRAIRYEPLPFGGLQIDVSP